MDSSQAAQAQHILAHGGAVYPSIIIVVKSTFIDSKLDGRSDAAFPSTPAATYSTLRQYRPHVATTAYRVPTHPDRAATLARRLGPESVLNVWYRREGTIIKLVLHVQPGAKRTEVIGLHGDALKIRLAAPPIEGRANESLLRFIAGNFDVPLCNVELKQGALSRHKVVLINGSTLEPESLLDSKKVFKTK